jgi:hypothetical protein
VIIGFIVGLLLAISIVGVVVPILLSRRGPLPPPAVPQPPALSPAVPLSPAEGESAEESGDDGGAAEQQPSGDENEPGRG